MLASSEEEHKLAAQWEPVFLKDVGKAMLRCCCVVLAASRNFGTAWSPCPGLPRVLVDVRHEAAHNELPTLALLQAAARAALAWLAAGYWQRQADHLAAWRGRTAELLQARQLHVTRWPERTHRPSCLAWCWGRPPDQPWFAGCRGGCAHPKAACA